MLGNHGIRQAAAAWRHPKALLQRRQRYVLHALALMQKGVHQLKRGHPHGEVQGLNHQSCSGVTVTAGQELLPEAPPALISEEVALVAGMQQGPRFGTQAIDQELQIDVPGSLLARGAIGVWELSNPVAPEVDDQSVVVEPFRHLATNQARRHRVDELLHLDRAGAPHPHRKQLVIGNTIGR